MSGLEVNKIIAAIIIAILIVILIDQTGDLLVNIDKNNQQDNEEGYKIASKIDVLQINNKSSEANEESIELVSPLLINASFDKGKKIFKKCSACHNYEKDSANKVGPNLWNIINKPIANTKGFAYSKALSQINGNWNYEELSKFLYKPKKYAKGTKMNFAGLKKNEDRANLLLFLRKQSDNPIPLP